MNGGVWQNFMGKPLLIHTTNPMLYIMYVDSMNIQKCDIVLCVNGKFKIKNSVFF